MGATRALDDFVLCADFCAMNANRRKFMDLAIAEAEAAAAAGEVPIGAVVGDGKSGEVLAAAGNRVESDFDPTAHAELLAIRSASAKRNSPRLGECDLYVTLEPCPMCCQAISFARLPKLVFGAYDAKGGGVEHGPKIFGHTTSHHNLEILGGIEEKRCGKILTDFFKKKRQEGSSLKKPPNKS